MARRALLKMGDKKRNEAEVGQEASPDEVVLEAEVDGSWVLLRALRPVIEEDRDKG